MRVKVARAFRDVDAGMLRDEGDEFEVSPSRFEAINSTKYGELVCLVETPVEGEQAPEVAPEQPIEVATEQPKATRRRRRKEQ